MAERQPGMYRLFQLSGQPIFAVPTSPRRLRLAGIARYQPVSSKRAVYRRVMSLLIGIGADRLVGRTVNDPVGDAHGFDFHEWMKQIRSDLNEPLAEGVVFWPPQRDRGRIYVHVFDSGHRPIAFAKVSFDDHNDTCLKREERVLRDLAEANPRAFRVPRVLALDHTCSNGHSSLLVEPIPEAARPLSPVESSYPDHAVCEFSGASRSLSADETRRASWWSEYEGRLSPGDQPFSDELQDQLSEGSTVCRVHGDFGTWNLVHDGESLWIFDWEECHLDGPALCDQVSFFLGVNRPRSHADHDALVDRFHSRFFGSDNSSRRVDVMLALAFHLTVNAQSASLIISRWNHS